MEYNVENWLKERGYKTASDGSTLSVTDGQGGSYALDTSDFTNTGGTYTGNEGAIRTALGKSGASGPKGYKPLRNTLAAAGATVGYDGAADAPIVNGQMLNKNDSRLVKVGDDYWIEENFAKNFVPKTYENPYNKKISSLLEELADMEFSYNPEKDGALQAAQAQAMLAAKQSANARGLLGGSTAEIMRQRAAQDLVPKYEQMAYARYADERDAKLETIGVLDTLAENAFAEYLGKENLQMEARKFAEEVQSTADERLYRIRTEALERDKLAQDKELKEQELAQSRELKQAELSQEGTLRREELNQAGELKREELEQERTMQKDALSQEALLTRERLMQEKQISDAELTQKKEAAAFSNQLDKVIVMGTVDEEASEILGLPVGTLTAEQLQFLTNVRLKTGAYIG